ncbi:hypothetical protein NPIL_36081 [Nephila pilipes]|uniref:Uncharacterized protein n=1 Tax=Nephila pilipes TaxID=299642 RepID=A0A8X6QM78_NEPPI|nr:hypothetical protein NPIL_36081 [Nephila pilipes]
MCEEKEDENTNIKDGEKSYVLLNKDINKKITEEEIHEGEKRTLSIPPFLLEHRLGRRRGKKNCPFSKQVQAMSESKRLDEQRIQDAV